MSLGARDDRGERAADRRVGDGPSLPYARAFVVQFSAETDGKLERVAGRIEHLQTGRRKRFTSIYDLLACLAALFPEENRATAKPGHRPASRNRIRGLESGPRDSAVPPASRRDGM